MNERIEPFSAEQMDFLNEMVNVGACNAATALAQVLQCRVNTVLAEVSVVTDAPKLHSLDDPSTPVTCAKMNMVGDATGDLLFVVPADQMEKFVLLTGRATPGADQSQRAAMAEARRRESADSIVAEMGNIAAGVYLRAIYDFCGLTMYHTVPDTASDMLQAILDESLAKLSGGAQYIVVLKCVYAADPVGGEGIRTFMLIIPSADSATLLASSMGQARQAMLRDEG